MVESGALLYSFLKGKMMVQRPTTAGSIVKEIVITALAA